MRGMRFGWMVVIAVLWPVVLVVAALLIGHTAPVSTVPRDLAGPGFLLGVWHGVILPISLVLSLVRDDVAIYAVVHDGEAYDVGFVIGILVMASGWWAPRLTRTVTYSSGPAR